MRPATLAATLLARRDVGVHCFFFDSVLRLVELRCAVFWLEIVGKGNRPRVGLRGADGAQLVASLGDQLVFIVLGGGGWHVGGRCGLVHGVAKGSGGANMARAAAIIRRDPCMCRGKPRILGARSL
jgi:hypothetical protein